MAKCYSQDAYDKYTESGKAATLRNSGGVYGGGSEALIVQGFPLGFRPENTKKHNEQGTTLCNGTLPGRCNAVLISGLDGYNGTLTGEKSATLGVNCGLSTGRNGVCIFQGQASSSAGISISDAIAPTLQASKYIDVLEEDSIVRRLTPLECERLQGFPDGWTQIGKVVDYKRHQEFNSDGTLADEWVEAIYEYVDCNGKKRKTTDSARYKALGNSIALPPWFWVLARLSLVCGTDTTMASLFDGIGGFPLIWQTLNGEGTCLWASEVEEFPIAVTQQRINGGNQ